MRFLGRGNFYFQPCLMIVWRIKRIYWVNIQARSFISQAQSLPPVFGKHKLKIMPESVVFNEEGVLECRLSNGVSLYAHHAHRNQSTSLMVARLVNPKNRQPIRTYNFFTSTQPNVIDSMVIIDAAPSMRSRMEKPRKPARRLLAQLHKYLLQNIRQPS